MSGTTYWRASEVEKIVDKLVPEHHEHLSRTDVVIRCVFRDTVAKSRGRIVLGKARKISGLNAHLVGLDRRDAFTDDPVDFFVIEIPHEPWQNLTPAQRIAARPVGIRRRTGLRVGRPGRCPMKALTIKQPWVWAVAAGHKDVENRSWSTSYRGPLAPAVAS